MDTTPIGFLATLAVVVIFVTIRFVAHEMHKESLERKAEK